MRTFRLLLIGFIVLFGFGNTSNAEIIHLEDAIEANSVTFIGNRANGFVMARKCDNCALQKLKLSPSTLVYSNGKKISINKVPSQAKTAITLIYDPKTKIVNKILM